MLGEYAPPRLAEEPPGRPVAAGAFDAPPPEDERYPDAGAPPRSRLSPTGVITCAGAENGIRWRPGERLEQLLRRRCEELRASAPGALAVDGPSGRLSYDELQARANQLARYLALRAGVRPGDRVALLAQRPVDGYVAMLAVLAVKAAYVPLDPSFPAERIAYIARDAAVGHVISSRRLSDRLSALDAGARVLYLEEIEVGVAGERDEPLSAAEAGEAVDDLCYVIYTSGTTGRPKGVPVRHPSICNFVRVAAEVYGVRPGERMYQGMTIAFDFSIEEIWVAWMAGATLVPRPEGPPLLGAELHAFLCEHRVSALCCVPTVLATLQQDLPELRFLLVSGESCPRDLVERWHRPGRRFLNVYGPTETTVSATWTLLHPQRPVTIGVPLPTYAAVVLDPDADRALGPGRRGELGIAGIGLADGYLGRPEQTARAFIPDFLQIPANPSRRIYRTGDLVSLNAAGELEHHGRIDTQVKVRGYRIELEEIEAVLRRAPGVAQAVVGTHEPEPGIRELAAYYTASGATGAADEREIAALLRARLPAYMVPAYLERLERIPMLPSGKADRGALPAPRRRLTGGGEHRAPGDELESLLAGELAAVLGAERVSVTSHFFEDLGANSLLMARWAARLRAAAPELAPVSMRAVYLHPTVRQLAATLRKPQRAGGPSWREPPLPAPVGTARHRLAGTLQLLCFLAAVAGLALVLDAASAWIFAAPSGLGLYLRSVAAGAGLLGGLGLLPIFAKWLLIGRFRPARIRAWSLHYVRFWIVKTLLLANPLPRLLVDTPLYALYLRALGARVGRRVLVLSQHPPIACDLVSIGSDAVIHRDAYLNGYRARGGVIEIGPVSIGAGATVGQRSVLEIGTALGEGSQLGHASSLQAGQSVPAKARWHGSPAQPTGGGEDYRAVPPLPSSALRRCAFAVARLVLLAAVAGPAEVLLGSLLLTHPRWIERLPLALVPVVAAVAMGGLLAAGLVVALTVPRLLSRALAPGRVYPLPGLHHTLARAVHALSNSPLLTTLFGDSCAIVHYLRLLGYRFGRIEQTGSNFGLQVRQDVPVLSHVGTGTMVSDGLSIMNAEFSSTSFRVRPVRIGARNYLGNDICFPPGARTGENVLFATRAMVPLSGPVRSDTGLLGSPPFAIPRSVQRDRRLAALPDGPERRARLRAKTRHNVVTMALHLLVDYLLALGLVAIALGPFGGRGAARLGGTVLSAVLELALTVALFVAAERAVLGFRRLAPRRCSIYERAFWRHERYWKVAPTGWTRIFDGTPFKAIMWRALGVRIGRRVLDDGLAITERTLVRIGSEATFNMGSTLQSHTLEDGAFKSDLIAVGERCTIGTGALVNYDVRIGSGSVVEADAFLMKGSRVEPCTRWLGNPATEVGVSAGGPPPAARTDPDRK
jgi:non-ribosomal peptide synthetase-like protein